MAIIYLYRFLGRGETFTGNQIRATNKGAEIEFIERLDQVGDFRLLLPATDAICSDLREDYIIGIDGKYYGIIRYARQVTEQGNNYVEVGGEDLKGYLGQVITLYPTESIAEGLQGYDAINHAATETVVKYFVNRNIVNPSNPKRKIQGFQIAEDQKRGNQDDQYMSRFEPLNELCQKNLNAVKMGYSVKMDLLGNNLVFDVIQGKQRTWEQYGENRVVFDVEAGALESLEYLRSQRNYRNAFYASLSGGANEAETLTCLCFRDGEEEPEGAERKEQHLNVSINADPETLFEQMKKYALKDAESYDKAETLTGRSTERYIYEKDYCLGDFVTLRTQGGLLGSWEAAINVQVTAVTHQWTKSGIVLNIPEFGGGKLNKFGLLKRQIRNGGS